MAKQRSWTKRLIVAGVFTAIASFFAISAVANAPVASVRSVQTPQSKQPINNEVAWMATPEACNDLDEQEANLPSMNAAIHFTVVFADKLEACRLLKLVDIRYNAAVAYMSAMGFAASDYVVGEDKIDVVAAQRLQPGPLAFLTLDGKVPLTHVQLGEAFTAPLEGNMKAADAKRAEYPSLSNRVLFDPYLWVPIQLKSEFVGPGYTGYSRVAGQIVNLQPLQGKAGEVFWLPVNPSTGLVRPMDVQPPNLAPGSPPAVGIIRAACLNGVNGLWPKKAWEDFLANPNVAPQYRDGGPTHTVSTDPNAANGYQGSLADVLAKEAADRAAAEAARKAEEEAAKKAAEDAEDVEESDEYYDDDGGSPFD